MRTRQCYDKEYGELDTPFNESYSIPLALSAADIVKCIYDKKTLSLFKAVAVCENRRSGTLRTKLKLSRKQYYMRIEKLIGIGLVSRISGKYRLTSFGEVVFSIHVKM